MHVAGYPFQYDDGISFFYSKYGGLIMNEIAEKDVINIENIIYEIDGKEVMLDSDLAKLYNVETKRFN